MTKDKGDLPRTMTQREAIRLLERYGWVRQAGGNHVVKMVKPGHRPVTLPQHRRRDYAVGLTRAILKQAGITSGDEER